MNAIVVQNVVRVTNGSNDASASELEADGIPSLEMPAGDLEEAMCTAHGRNAPTTAELVNDGTSAAKMLANAFPNALNSISGSSDAFVLLIVR